ncbi:MAG: hypothetical protein IKR78_03795 [Dehalococcoidales bacterium]|nr:hypothetical protein [Dehalococcoidales bacterium]
MKKIIGALIAVMMIMSVVCLVGCGGYTSHYKAIAFVHSNTSDSSFMTFSHFEGTMVFKMKNGAENGLLRYSAKLGEGSATVFCDCNGAKQELFTVRGGDGEKSSLVHIDKGTVYVIVETSGNCDDGEFRFDIE